MKTLVLASALVAGSAVAASAASISGSTGYLLAEDGQSVVIIDDLGNAASSREVTLSGGTVAALSYRPRTGQLYGYSVGTSGAEDDQVFEIDLSTGQLINTNSTYGAGVGGIASDARIGFDFNNSLDAARIVSTQTDNLVFFPNDTASGNPNAGGVIRANGLFYGMGDVNEGVTPSIFANAYTNAVDGEVSPTTLQFAIDSNTDALTTLANNAGTLTTIGGLGLDVYNIGGFEILSDAQGDNLGIALLREATGNSGLYTIDFNSGLATAFADLGQREYTSFAAQTAALTPVPLPATSLLLLAGLGGLGLMKRRKA